MMYCHSSVDPAGHPCPRSGSRPRHPARRERRRCQDDGYTTPDATSDTKTNAPLRDVPQTINVVPTRVLEDQHVNSMQDLVHDGKESISETDLQKIREVFRIFIEDILGLVSESGSTTNNEAYKKAVDLLLNIRQEAKQKKD